ncbi:hypothetical protein COCOR_04416 [Corallococcus coralloides DSM 2259]|uniref:Schlafen group 3-like DNA/RNA helicase domain-containing protein n=1 Tax=Corallococcus coralloides (strain ATCC 25202 / DSM 2259 / NBRC 100086 / M2) TaxID=1144275 RepID=H8MF97_CORCM|nr:DUF2075 domain-containing protein [Corallococcus coralloides]AFE05818.1 hypothetical protein COCOR_04416 [Corallococcus coralloides DSM 2259]
MHLYSASVPDFIKATREGTLVSRLVSAFEQGQSLAPTSSEQKAWRHSLPPLAAVLDDASFERAYIFLELQMPLSSHRCDALLVGRSARGGRPSAVVVELKQWTHAGRSAIPDTVSLGSRTLLHPSAQARGYADFLHHYHSAFTSSDAEIHACAYLHNLEAPAVLGLLRASHVFGPLTRDVPLFAQADAPLLREYLKDCIGAGDGGPLSEAIRSGQAQPSEKLLDVLIQAVEGHFEWRLLDEQRVAFNTITTHVEQAQRSGGKAVIVVRGGPGTGKSVLAIQLLAHAARHQWRIAHAVGSKAFQTVLQAKTEAFATEMLKRIYNVRYQNRLPLRKMFSTFADIAGVGAREENTFDLVVGDEAHRLWNYRRAKFQNFERQLSNTPMVDEMIRASRVTALFLDDNQTVRADEVGTLEHIRSHAESLRVPVTVVDLNAQFRCSGSESYMQWVDHALGFHAPRSLQWREFQGYDFTLVGSMQEMQERLEAKRRLGNKCRIAAGFCWRWSPPKDNGELVHDVSHPSFSGWSAPWIEKTGRDLVPTQHQYFKWATDEAYFSQVGSIYSIQGFEFDYIGVIFGPDLVWREAAWQADLEKNRDTAFRRDLKRSGTDGTERLRNIYRVLLTRGMRGTLVYFIDHQTRARFEALLQP